MPSSSPLKKLRKSLSQRKSRKFPETPEQIRSKEIIMSDPVLRFKYEECQRRNSGKWGVPRRKRRKHKRNAVLPEPEWESELFEPVDFMTKEWIMSKDVHEESICDGMFRYFEETDKFYWKHPSLGPISGRVGVSRF